MPKRSSKKKDINETAFSIVGQITGEISNEDATPKKSPAAVELGRLGGLKGGKARANSLTAEQRRHIAQKAAATRWKKDNTSS